jgi:hypothetical protein
MVDHAPMEIPSLDPADARLCVANVAGPAALLVAKLHKLGQRADEGGDRLIDKDAHDIYRLLVATSTLELAARLQVLRADDLAGSVTEQALTLIDRLFRTPGSVGATMAGRAEALLGDPEVVAASTAALVGDLLSVVSS